MNETWCTTDGRVLDYFNKKENTLPFSIVILNRGFLQAKGEWDGLVFYSKKVKKRLVKKALRLFLRRKNEIIYN